jgi:hypothetical protein
MTRKKSYKLTAALPPVKKIPYPPIHYMFAGRSHYVEEPPARKAGRPQGHTPEVLAMMEDIAAMVNRPLRHGEATRLVEEVKRRHPEVSKRMIFEAIANRRSAIAASSENTPTSARETTSKRRGCT